MTLLEWIGLGIAALAGGLTAAMRQWKIGPWNPDNMPTNNVPDFTDIPYMPIEPPISPVDASSPQDSISGSKKPSVADFCLSISMYEGGPGDANHRNNNPGNVRYNYVGGYLPMYGVVKCSPAGFAIFKDWATGMLYLNNMVKNMIKNHPTESILTFMQRYAPVSENDPLKYAQFIAKNLGVTVDYPMKSLV